MQSINLILRLTIQPLLIKTKLKYFRVRGTLSIVSAAHAYVLIMTKQLHVNLINLLSLLSLLVENSVYLVVCSNMC